jgi:hypothetical protein
MMHIDYTSAQSPFLREAVENHLRRWERFTELMRTEKKPIPPIARESIATLMFALGQIDNQNDTCPHCKSDLMPAPTEAEK